MSTIATMCLKALEEMQAKIMVNQKVETQKHSSLLQLCLFQRYINLDVEKQCPGPAKINLLLKKVYARV